MKDFSVSSIIDLISSIIGVQIRPSDYESLERKISSRIKTLGFASAAAYYQHLTFYASNPEHSEWRELINFLTTTETHFFRDQGQFSLLRQRILPELIEKKANASIGGRPSLRLWSAGCSTGEEAHSLAILLTELIPNYHQWNILVLGTDINQKALQHARQGVYSNWSFRSVHAGLKNQYFQSYRHGWSIDSKIQDLVKFQSKNLVYDEYPQPDSEIHDFDLILCRNVFIYFSAQVIGRVLKKFFQALTPDGYLLTGHTELQGQNLQQFETISFPESVVYRRKQPSNLGDVGCEPFKKRPVEVETLEPICKRSYSPALSQPAPPQQKNFIAPVTLEKQPTVEAALAEIKQLLQQKLYIAAIERAKETIAYVSKNALIHYLAAQAYANLGDYTQAIWHCEQSVQIDILAASSYYLMVQIAEEKGEIDRAKALLKKVIYLMPTSVYAYAELGFLYEKEGSLERARRNWRSALNLLQKLAADELIYENLTAGELQTRLTKYFSI